MSYPDKNQDKKWGPVDPSQQEETKSSLTEATQKPKPKEQKKNDTEESKDKKELKEKKDVKKDTLPVGLLKWSKDEEENQDTHLSLDKSDALDSDREVQDKKNPLRPGAEVDSLSSAADQKDESGMGESVKSTGHSPSGQTERSYSLEDTLTPIDFKEYSLTPNNEANKDPEIEVKQPAYIVDFSEEIAKADEDDKESSTAFVESGSEERKNGKYTDEEQDVAEEERPVWVKAIKIAWLPVTLVVVLIAGLIVGHTVIGKQPAGDVFDMNMWKHIYQLLFNK